MPGNKLHFKKASEVVKGADDFVVLRPHFQSVLFTFITGVLNKNLPIPSLKVNLCLLDSGYGSQVVAIIGR